jgi:hypothetical protein
VVEVPSEDVFEKVVDFFFATNPILSSSADWSKAGVEGLRNNPLTDARGFSGREERVLLPDLIAGTDVMGLAGHGDRDCGRIDALRLGDGSFAVLDGGALLVCTLDGVLSDLVLGRLTGV